MKVLLVVLLQLFGRGFKFVFLVFFGFFSLSLSLLYPFLSLSFPLSPPFLHKTKDRGFKLDTDTQQWIWEQLIDQEEDSLQFSYPLPEDPEVPTPALAVPQYATRAETEKAKGQLQFCSPEFIAESLSSFQQGFFFFFFPFSFFFFFLSLEISS